MRDDLTEAQRRLLRGLGLEIQQRRKNLRLTQAELAHRAGVHMNSLSNMEQGMTNVSLLQLDAVVEQLDTDLAEVFAAVLKKR